MRAQKRNPPRRSRIKQFIIGCIVLLALVASIIFILGYRGSTESIESVANKLKTPSHWTLKSERITPPGLVCLGDSPCPSLHRDWTVEKLPSTSEFKNVLKDSGISFPIHGDCEQPPTQGTPSMTCQAQGAIDTYHVEISVLGTKTTEYGNHVILSVRPM